MVKIRLQRQGKKKAPFYHIVVADSKSPRDGKIIEQLGTYNPMTEPATIVLDKEKVEKIAKKKAKELQRKAEDLVDLAKEKGTPVLEGIADDLKHKVICVCTEIINKLEKGE